MSVRICSKQGPSYGNKMSLIVQIQSKTPNPSLILNNVTLQNHFTAGPNNGLSRKET